MSFRISERASKLGLYFLSGYVALGIGMLYYEMRDNRNSAYGYSEPAPSPPQAPAERRS